MGGPRRLDSGGTGFHLTGAGARLSSVEQIIGDRTFDVIIVDGLDRTAASRLARGLLPREARWTLSRQT